MKPSLKLRAASFAASLRRHGTGFCRGVLKEKFEKSGIGPGALVYDSGDDMKSMDPR
jgi:hypothetical protein